MTMLLGALLVPVYLPERDPCRPRTLRLRQVQSAGNGTKDPRMTVWPPVPGRTIPETQAKVGDDLVPTVAQNF